MVVWRQCNTDKTSLKADREDWGEGGVLLVTQLAPELTPQLASQFTPILLAIDELIVKLVY